MKKYAGFRNGYVRVRIYGEQTERFLNLCRARELEYLKYKFIFWKWMDFLSFFTEVKRERLFFLDYFYVQDCFCSCPDGCGKLM